MFMRIRCCKSMNQADPRAGRRKRGGVAQLRMGVLVSFLVACVCTVASSAQTSGDLALGLSEFSKGNFTSAAALFARAEEAAPGATDALLYEGKAYIHLEQFTAAEGALRRYLLAHATSSDALYLLGYVLHREGKAAESLEMNTKGAQLRTPTGDDLKIVGLNYVLLMTIRTRSSGWRKPWRLSRRIRKPGIFWGAPITRNRALRKRAKPSRRCWLWTRAMQKRRTIWD